MEHSKSLNGYSISAIISSLIGLSILNITSDNDGKMLAALFNALSVTLLIIGVCISIKRTTDSQNENKENCNLKEQEQNIPLKKPQTLILPKNADEAEKAVMHAIHRKVAEYEAAAHGRFAKYLYHETDELQELENKLSNLQKELKHIGHYEDGGYCFCSFLFIYDYNYTQSMPKYEMVRHFSMYFNERCEKIIKRAYQDGLDKCKSKIAVFANHMLYQLSVSIDSDYLALKIQEAEIRYHITRIKEEQRQAEIEERKAQKDYERALKDAAKNEEKARLQLEKQREALEKAASEQEKIKLQEKVTTLEQKLQEALTMKERALSMAQQTRVGYVYVISNTRSFGEDVYKIGMTRRLEPMDRVRELSDASVPFAFDVHYMIYTDDAPKLESQLHQRFADSRINADNYRKEFFRVPLTKITEVLNEIGILPNERAD